jgi:hypothetical protein
MKTSPLPRVSLAFTRRAIALLLVFGRNVIVMMTGSPNYTTPFPTLTTVTTAIDALDAANQDALEGGRMAISIRKGAKVEALSLLRELAAYVQGHCQSDRTILLSSGFDPVRAPQPIGALPPPGTPIVRQGVGSGQLRARVPKVNGATAYNWRIALGSAPTVYVQTVQTTGGRYEFVGLTPGETYLVQANALGALGASDWSSAQTMMVI